VARAAARLDRDVELAFLPQEDGEAEPLLAALPEDERFATWHLAMPDGSLHGRGSGLPVLLRAMRVTRPAGRLLARAPSGALDRVYALIADHRARLGRLVPDQPGPRRYP
jgi:predicted DCC family thiol-disulfide oxidoreductase YuxK